LIVADTHAWLWWLSDDRRLSAAARRALESARAVGVPAACCWEVAWLAATRKIELRPSPAEWLRKAVRFGNVALLPMTPDIAVRGATLGRAFCGDPGDRQIVGTALQHSAPLVTCDGKIRDSGLVETIW